MNTIIVRDINENTSIKKLVIIYQWISVLSGIKIFFVSVNITKSIIYRYKLSELYEINYNNNNCCNKHEISFGYNGGSFRILPK